MRASLWTGIFFNELLEYPRLNLREEKSRYKWMCT